MPTRICPKCKSDLGSNDYYFCSSCGTALSANLIQIPSIVKVSRFVPPQTNTAKVFRQWKDNTKKKAGKVVTKRNVFLTFVALLLISNVALVTLLLLRPTYLEMFRPLSNDSEKKISLVVPNTIDLGLEIPSQTFGTDNITSYVPKDAEFYLEAFGYSYLVEKYLPVNIAYNDLITESSDLIRDHFAVFAVKKADRWEWTGIFVPWDTTEVAARLESIHEENITFKIIDDKLIVTTDPEIITEIEEAKSQTALNLSLSPKYASAKAKISKDGQILVMFLSPRSNEVLTQIRNNLPTRLVKNAVDQILRAGYNEFVVRKD